MKKKGIKLFIVALASFLMLVCIVAASPDSTLQFIDPTPANYTQEQDFTCGVLAINTHKSIYLPNEAASIGIAVLDNEGHMVCDADVTLTITDPSDTETVLSTDNGLIKVSPQCCVYGVTNLPDFYTNYTVDGAGTYEMNLTVTAVTADGTKSITDVFTVQNSVDFDVARDGATRIYPSVPHVMNFTIKANKDYDGLIREYVPASFDITPQDGLTVTTVGDTDTKILTWNKNLVEGETYNIYYVFDAPDVSPEFYLLGALEIGSFKELRQWLIASDAPDIEDLYVNGFTAATSEWNKSGNSPYIDDSDANYIYTDRNNDDDANYGFTDPSGGAAGAGTINSVTLYFEAKEAATSSMYAKIHLIGVGAAVGTVDPTSTSYGWYTIDVTAKLNTWQKITDAQITIQAKTADPALYIRRCYLKVDYTAPTWASYSDLDHLIPCDNFVSYADEHTVYMFGEGFRPSTPYKIIFWDGGGANRKTDNKNSEANGDLSSSHTFVAGTDQAGTWYATVYYPQSHSPGSHDPNDVYLVADDTFEVQEGAIPEFSTVIAAIAVGMLCAVAYMVMRRKVKG